MIRNIVFDVGDVLVAFCWDDVARKLGFSEELVAKFRKNMIELPAWNEFDRGTVTEEQVLEAIRQAMPENEAELKLLWSHKREFTREYPTSAPIIRHLKNKGYRVYLLSNYPKELRDVHWPSFSFTGLVDGIVVSADVRMVKPDVEIFEKLCELYGLNAGECLFVDDRDYNVEGARRAGMHGLVYEGEKTIEKLRQMPEPGM
jgi:putative hydrolase of the HAD superfamily